MEPTDAHGGDAAAAVHPVLAAQMPSLASRVTITLRSGDTLNEEFGTRENPRIGLDDPAIEAKFRDFARHHFSDANTAKVLQRCWSLEQQTDIGALLECLEVKEANSASAAQAA